MQMFLDRYRQHAQNILEVIVKAAFSEVYFPACLN